jgi:ubiquinone/menaquinone biosynthesis C-methylase UbiE
MLMNSESENSAEMAKGDWENFSAGQLASACPAWRRYCDRLNENLIAEWCGGRDFRRALKTDVFDEAVGEGCFPALAKVAGEVHGVDVSQPLVGQVSRGRPGFFVKPGDVRRLEFPDDSFDLVFSNSTLDHFETEAEIEQSVLEFARVLEVRGRLLITLDNPVNPFVWIRNRLPQRATGAVGLVPYFMGKTLPMKKLARLLERSGFCILEQQYTMHAPRVFFLHLLGAIRKFPAFSNAVLGSMTSMEVAAGLPTASLTGHYSAVLAERIH